MKGLSAKAMVALWIAAIAVELLLFGWWWAYLFFVRNLVDVVVPLVLPGVLIGVTWRWFDARRQAEARRPGGQMAVWWAFAAWSAMLILRLGGLLDGRVPTYSIEGLALLLVFLVVLFVWIPARMIQVTWRWARAPKIPTR